MKRISLIVILALMFSVRADAQTYSVEWWVVGSGGGHGESENFSYDGTAGQHAAGRITSGNFIVDAGFWAGASGPQCEYIPGDANGNGEYNGIDVTFSVLYLKGGGDAPPDSCYCRDLGFILVAADANGNCAFNGIDVTFSVSFLKGSGPAPTGCIDCPPMALARPGNDVIRSAKLEATNK